ncbi:MAG: TIGR01777 family oxidoreductase [Thermaerobacter sp.]
MSGEPGLERPAEPAVPRRVCIAGGSGFIGSALARHWLARGAEVTILTRGTTMPPPSLSSPPPSPRSTPPQKGTAAAGSLRRVSWGDEPAWRRAVAQADVVVNLAGATISRRWTRAYKEEILNSRLGATRRLVEALGDPEAAGDRVSPGAPDASGAACRPVLVNASAVGYYGPSGDLPLTERNAPGEDFLATVCARWEAAARPAEDAGARVVLLRIGLVLGRDGGVLPRMLLPFRLGLGGVLGSGRQWVSWIHIDDLCRLIIFAAENPAIRGPLNATAPEPVTNRQFTRALARTLGRPAFLRVPAAALRLVLGEMSTLLLDGQRVIPQRALDAGFEFRFPTIEAALTDLLRRHPA